MQYGNGVDNIETALNIMDCIQTQESIVVEQYIANKHCI